MAKDNNVIFKGRKNGLIIALRQDVGFLELRRSLFKKLLEGKEFFQGTELNILFSGRRLSDGEEDDLVEIITRETAMKINVIHAAEDYTETYLSTEEETGEFFAEEVNKTVEENYIPDLSAFKTETDAATRYHRGSLRSGQSIRFAGGVVVVGDVNPGAEIIAEGSIIVLGALKGLAHAGCSGDPSCIVSALTMQPTQLRIAELITFIPPDLNKKYRRKPNPVFAYVNGGKIYIEALTN